MLARWASTLGVITALALVGTGCGPLCTVGTTDGCSDGRVCVEDSDQALSCEVCALETNLGCDEGLVCAAVDDPEAEEPFACVPPSCTPGTAEGCALGLFCEEVEGGVPGCFAPIEVRGRVFDLATDDGIEGATVVALDPNGGARSNVVQTAVDGTYRLPVSSPRTEDGRPVSDELTRLITLRVAGAGYQAFPTFPRTALPIDLADAVIVEEEIEKEPKKKGAKPEVVTIETLVVKNAATDVALIALPGGAGGLGVIVGRVDHPDAGGVLVAAEQGGTAVSTAISDSSGAFTLFNVPAGSTVVAGYRAGLVITPETVDADARVDGVILAASDKGLTTVSGSVNIVNAPGGSVTSVVLALESTFVENAARGEVPAGLRAPGVTGAFSIEGVPPGNYVVLAAFENDLLVRDPDEGIGGTELVHITVPEGGGNMTLDQSFKVTEALAVRSPGRDEVEVVTSSSPSFVWADDSSEDGYELRLYDAFGTLVFEDTEVPRVSGGDDVSYTLEGASLEAGLLYQFRVVSFRESGGGGRTYISATEDLRGVFIYQP